ncbi:MAG: M56 family metallopeptidase [candidate division WOR-3 bacterium]
MNFLIKTLTLYIILSIIILVYKELPFSKINLRKKFPYLLIIVFILSFLPFYIYYKAFLDCNLKCLILGPLPLNNKIFFIPLISFTLFFILLTKYLIKELKYKKLPLILYGKNKEGISVNGIFKPFIFIDKTLWKSLSKKERKIILLHEINHIRQKDTFIKLIISLLSKTFFYLPHFFLLRKTFEEIAELASDEYTLIKTSEKENIVKTIAKLSLILNSNLNFSFTSSPILKRIDSLSTNRKSKTKFFLFTLFLSALFITLISFFPLKENCGIDCQNLKTLCHL